MVKQLDVDGLLITLERKRVKNVNLAIYPPDGRVRISAPRHCSEETIRSVVRARWPWIMNKRAALQARPPVRPLVLSNGQAIPFFGATLELEILEKQARPAVYEAHQQLILQVRPDTSEEKRRKLLESWYRQRLAAELPGQMEKWQALIGVGPAEWRIRRMKSRWGTCNIRDRRICLNLELARLPKSCLEYVVVHELVHLLERGHNRRFWQLVSAVYPDWREVRTRLRQVVIDPCW